MTPVLESATQRLVHSVSVTHASTGEPIAALSARLTRPRPGWSVRAHGHRLAVTAMDGAPSRAEAPVLHIEVLDPLRAALLATPALDLTLSAVHHDVTLQPIPMTLGVTLVDPTGPTAVPATGRLVEAQAGTGTPPRSTIPLTETEPGFYLTAPVVWRPEFLPLNLLVGGVPLRPITVDLSRRTTRVRLVATS